MNNITAKSQQKIFCRECRSVMGQPFPRRCLHCHAPLHSRIPRSLNKSWCYLLTAIVLFFPANLLPISATSYLGSTPQEDTIFTSIVLLWSHGSYVIALIIFLASIMTPFFKIMVLLYLLLNHRPRRPPIWQTKLYHLIHLLGRWSMIDVFVVALLAALINGNLASIRGGPGIFAFAAVVFFTMLATESFDTRLLWDYYFDHAHEKEEKN